MDIIHWLQASHSPLGDVLWGAITQLSSEDFFIIVLPIIFWCVNSRTGWLLFTLLMASVVSSDLLKSLVGEARPDPSQVRVLLPETSEGASFPSGHTENATVVCGFLAAQWKRWMGWVGAGLLILLVGTSRLYLGLHWPIDVLGGFLIGAVLVGLGLWINARWGSHLDNASRWLLVGLIAPIAIFVLFPSKYTAVAVGALTGMNTGYLVLLPRFGGTFPVRGPLPQQIAKIIIGWLGLLLLRTVLKSAFPDALVFHFVRYAAIGLWAGFLAPLVFKRLFAIPQAALT